ncbi:MAG: hypothetical protein A2161_01590 [Candidatus Schekmanbacteria bacterium RBG_13_48_7]|uniref:Pyruvate/ketoisovalerate oxidoreductase catalytic domain-containing protein n=1 Tax=Candidatus Schekmanbacteria bacterium RBG_13_48_7 TaxID=1817878 RepID=A0A1F7RQQ5_9BACT|nr:MAG: hypothetical protein A2161_01590 [Candidatus Schekmanbacteria bacterium RBG_13_48_7]
MGSRCEIRLSGAGGQGLILVGKILAESAAVYDGKNATHSQSYGPEARGVTCKSDVIISDSEINFPKIGQLDILVAFAQEACDKYISCLKPDGTLILDSSLVTRIPAQVERIIQLPFQKISQDELGIDSMGNIIVLGVLTHITDFLSVESVESAILSRVPKGKEEINLKAFKLGLRIAENLAASV